MLRERIAGGTLALGLYIATEALTHIPNPTSDFMRNWGRDIMFPVIVTSFCKVIAPEEKHRGNRVGGVLLIALGDETKQGLFPDLLLFGEKPSTFDWLDYGAIGIGGILAHRFDKLVSRTISPQLTIKG